jgi:hypothetical protein
VWHRPDVWLVTFAVRTADTIDTIMKPRIYKRKNIKGWRVGWYEGGKKKAKALPSKALAEHFRHIKYTQLNSDVFTGLVDIAWRQMVSEYCQSKRVEGLQAALMYKRRLTLRRYERLVGSSSSRHVTLQSLDEFILERSKEVTENTLDKDMRTCMHSSIGQLRIDMSRLT